MRRADRCCGDRYARPCPVAWPGVCCEPCATRRAAVTPNRSPLPASVLAIAPAARAVSTLTPGQVFHVAAYVEMLAHGEDRGRWALSKSYAADTPEYRWQCDEPRVTGRAR